MVKRHWNVLTGATERVLRGTRGATEFYNGEKRYGRDAHAAIADGGRSRTARLLAGLMIFTAIVMLTFVAASSVAGMFTGTGKTRLTHVTAEQLAAAEYRKARVRCQMLGAAAREACITEAHAAEQRARAVSTASRRDYVTSLRAQTDAAIDAGDRDRIIVEPACNIVARGQGSLCEIQVKPGAIGTNLIPAKMTAKQYAAANPLPPPKPRHVAPPAPVAPQASLNPFARAENREDSMARILELAWSNRQ